MPDVSGQANDLPVTGDWNSDGSDEIGSFVNGFRAIDYNGNYPWTSVVVDRFAAFGRTDDLPVVGKW